MSRVPVKENLRDGKVFHTNESFKSKWCGTYEFLLGTVLKLCRNGEKEYFSIFGRREDISLWKYHRFSARDEFFVYSTKCTRVGNYILYDFQIFE